MVGVILLGAVAAALIFVVLSQSESTDTPIATVPATNAPTTSPATTGSATTAAAPAEVAPVAAFPPQLDELLEGAEVAEYEDLTAALGVVTVGGEFTTTATGMAVSGHEDTGGLAGFLYGPPGEMRAGDAVAMRFLVDARTSLVFVLENNAELFPDPGYRRFGFRMDPPWDPGAVVSEHWDGGEEITGFARLGNFDPASGAEYVTVIARGDKGTFVLGVWESGFSRAVEFRDFGTEWDEQFGFYLAVETGRIVLREYWWMTHSGITEPRN